MFNSLLKTIGVEDNDGAGEGGNETSSSGAAAPPVADAGADAGAAPRGPPREEQQQQQRAPSNQRRWPLGIYRGGHEEDREEAYLHHLLGKRLLMGADVAGDLGGGTLFVDVDLGREAAPGFDAHRVNDGATVAAPE